MLAELPGMGDRSALGRTIAKLEEAAGAAAGPSSQVAFQVDHQAGEAVLAEVTEALARARRVHLSYYVPGRDEATERDVDPMRLVMVEGRNYLEGWCRRANAVRLFRLDRILSIKLLEVPAEVPAGAELRDVDQGLFRPSSADTRVVLELDSRGPLGGRVLPVRGSPGARRRPAAGEPAHSRHPVGAAAGAAARPRRPGHRAARGSGDDRRGRGGSLAAVCVM